MTSHERTHEPDTVERKVIFLTESGHPPTEKTMSGYLKLFFEKQELDLDQPMHQVASGGPDWNQASLLAEAISKNPYILRIAVLNDNKCHLVGPELFSAFTEAINENSAKSSWRIAMDLVGNET